MSTDWTGEQVQTQTLGTGVYRLYMYVQMQHFHSLLLYPQNACKGHTVKTCIQEQSTPIFVVRADWVLIIYWVF